MKKSYFFIFSHENSENVKSKKYFFTWLKVKTHKYKKSIEGGFMESKTSVVMIISLILVILILFYFNPKAFSPRQEQLQEDCVSQVMFNLLYEEWVSASTGK